MRKELIGVSDLAGLLAGCNAEPTYSGVSLITYNHALNLEPACLSDTRNVASSSTLAPGGGADGSLLLHV